MPDMNKEALEFLSQQAVAAKKPDAMEIAGRVFTDKPICPLPLVYPATMDLTSLQGIIDYLLHDKPDDPLIYVKSHSIVQIVSKLFGPNKQRDTFAEAEAIIEPFRFGHYYTMEEFIVGLQAKFMDNTDKSKVLSVCGTVERGEVKTNKDDGVTQTVSVKAGIQLKAEMFVPNPVTLQPHHRTFADLPWPPTSLFVLRMQADGNGNPMAALFEADGAAWKIEAIKEIKRWLSDAMKKDGLSVPIIG